MKLLMLLSLGAGLLFGQTVSYTPGAAPQSAVPTKVVATAGTGTTAVACTLTGDTFPAAKVTIACTVGPVTIAPYTIAFTAGTAYTFQHNFDTNAVTFSLSVPSSGGPIAFQATANGSAPTNGTF